MKPVRVAFVGNALATSPMWFEGLLGCGARLEAVCDGDPERAAQTAERYAVRWSFGHLGEMLAETEPELLVVGAGHADQRIHRVREALRRGANVVVTAPPTPDLRGWDRLVLSAKQARKFVMLGLPHRFSPAAERAAKVLAAGVLGEPLSIAVTLRRWQAPGAASTNQAGDDLDMAFDALDRVCHFLGPVRWVAASAGQEGAISAALRVTGGAVGSLSAQAAPGVWAVASRVEMVGSTGGLLELVDDCRLRYVTGDGCAEEHVACWSAGARPSYELGYEGVLTEALAALRAARSPAASLHGVRDSLAATRALTASAAKGRGVWIRSANRLAGP